MGILYRKKWDVKPGRQVEMHVEENSSSMADILNYIRFCNKGVAPGMRAIIIIADKNRFNDIKNEFKGCFVDAGFSELTQRSVDDSSEKYYFWLTSAKSTDTKQWYYIDAIENTCDILLESAGLDKSDGKEMYAALGTFRETLAAAERYSEVSDRSDARKEAYGSILAGTRARQFDNNIMLLNEKSEIIKEYVFEGLLLIENDDDFNCNGRFLPGFIKGIYEAIGDDADYGRNSEEKIKRLVRQWSFLNREEKITGFKAIIESESDFNYIKIYSESLSREDKKHLLSEWGEEKETDEDTRDLIDSIQDLTEEEREKFIKILKAVRLMKKDINKGDFNALRRPKMDGNIKYMADKKLESSTEKYSSYDKVNIRSFRDAMEERR